MGLSDWTRKTARKLEKRKDKQNQVKPNGPQLTNHGVNNASPSSSSIKDNVEATKAEVIVSIQDTELVPTRTQQPGKSLWDKAYENLLQDPEFSSHFIAYRKHVLERAGGLSNRGMPAIDTVLSQVIDVEHEAEQIQQWAKEELETLETRRFLLSASSKGFQARAGIYKVIQFLNKYKAVVTAAVAAEPIAAFAWGGFVAILPFLENIFQQDQQATAGFKQICYLLAQSNVVESRLRSARGEVTMKSTEYCTLVSAVEDNIVSLYSLALRYQIRFILQYSRRQSFQAVRNAFSVDDWNVMVKEAEDLSKRVLDGAQQLASDVIQAMYNELSTFANDVRTFQEEVHKDLELIKGHGESAMLDKLPYVGSALFNSRVMEEHGGCLEGTQVAVLNAIQEWLNDAEGQFIFWLYGLAGTGKSSVAMTVAKALYLQKPLVEHTSSISQENLVLGATFFFSLDDQSRSSTANLIPTMAWCLGRAIPQLKKHVAEVIQNNSNIANLGAGQQLTDLIIKPLSALTRESISAIRFVIVLDALDECLDKDEARSLLRMLTHLNELTHVQVRILVTSRHEYYILKAFQSMDSDLYRSLSLRKIRPQRICQSGSRIETSGSECEDEEGIDGSEDDISRFLKVRLSQISLDRDFPNGWLHEEKFQSLKRMCRGLFICASVACRFLDHDLYDEDDLDARLTQILDGGEDYRNAKGHPNGIYKSVLRYHYTGRGKDDRTSNEMDKASNEIKTILGTIVTLFEPVCMDTLNWLLPKKHSQLKRQLAAFGALVNIPNNDSGRIHVIHLSFREFILDGTQCPVEYLVDVQSRHHAIIERCLLIMKEHLREDICNLRQPGVAQSEVKPEVINKCIPAHVQYSCLYWIDHLGNLDGERKSQVLTDGGVLHKFLSHSFLFWLEALSLLGRMIESIRTMNRLHDMIRESDSPELFKLVQDAISFLRDNRQAIKEAPLQAYSSALIFSPSSSIIRKSFWHLVPSWVVTAPRVQELWTQELLVLEHRNIIAHSVQFSPDDKMVATGTCDGTLRLWDTSTGIEITQSIEIQPSCIKTLSFSKNGKLVVFGKTNGSLGLWEPVTGRIVELGEMNTVFQAVTMSPDGDIIAMIGLWRSTELWSLKEGKIIRSLEAPLLNGRYRKPHGDVLEFTSDGRFLAFTCTEHGDDDYEIDMIVLWDLDEGKIEMEVECDSSKILATSLSKTGEIIAAASENGTIRMWQERKWNVVQLLSDNDPITAAAFAPGNDNMLAVGHESGMIRFYHTPTGQSIGILNMHTAAIVKMAFSAEGSVLASASEDTTVRLSDMKLISRQQISNETIDYQSDVDRVQFLPGHDDIVAVYRPASDGVFGWTIWDCHTGGDMTRRDIQQNISHLEFSPSVDVVALIYSNKSAQLWDSSLHQTVSEVFPNIERVQFSPGGNFVALHHEVEIDESKHPMQPTPHAVSIREFWTWNQVVLLDSVLELSFSPINDIAAYTSSDHTLRVLDTKQGRQLCQVDNMHDSNTLDFSKSGTHLSCVSIEDFSLCDGSSPGRILLLDIKTGNMIVDFLDDSILPPCTLLSPDGRYFAAVTDEQDINVWDTANRDCLISVDMGHVFNLYYVGPLLRYLEICGNGTIGMLLSRPDSLEGRATSRFYFWHQSGDAMPGLEVDAFLESFAFSPDGQSIETKLGTLRLPPPSLALQFHSVSANEISKEPIWLRGNWICQGLRNVLRIPAAYLQVWPSNVDGKFVLGRNEDALCMEVDFKDIPDVAS